MEFKDYYQILGVDRQAKDSEIKAAYRKAARKYHPDLHAKGDKAAAEEKFKEINEAYAVLGDAEKRAQYDGLGEKARSGQAWQPEPAAGGYGGGSWNQTETDGFSDFFASLFGQSMAGGFPEGFGPARSARGQNLAADIELTLEEAYRGGQKAIQLSLQGSCPACGGTGVAGQRRCAACGGTGDRQVVKTLDVTIPAFIREGSKIRLKGQGGEGSAQGGPGDLLLTVRILPHTCFTLKGSSLETTAKIHPEQAVLGCRISVPTLDGDVMMTIPPMAHHGQKLRLRSKGWLDRDGRRGDEYVKLVIDIPRTLKPGEQELYQRLAELRKDVC